MIDINTYRQRIGSFKQPGQRKSKISNLRTKGKVNPSSFRNILHFLVVLLALTLSVSFHTEPENQVNYGKELQSHSISSHSTQKENLYNQVLSSAQPQLVLENNFYARCTYGNRNNRGIKLSHWNAGSAHLPNKLDEIESVISRHHPLIFGISESNLHKKHQLQDVQIQDYELITAETLDNPKLQYSRVVVYKHSSIVGKVRSDLMNNEFSSIWLECGLPNKKKFLVCNFYREWQYLGQGADKSSLDVKQQLSRWVSFIDQFERALDTGMEIYCLGDANLDFLTWTKTDLNPQHRSVKQKPLIIAIFDRILSRGVKQLVTTFTHSWPGQENSGLDHFYTNAPGKVSSLQILNEGHSDHKIIHAVRVSKSIKSQARYVKKRSYKNFDENAFMEEVKKTSWWEVYSCEDANEAAAIFTTKLSKILDRHAPVRTFQTRTNFAPWLSEETKHLMKDRDRAQLWASSTQNQTDWASYRVLRNKITKRLKSEKKDWQKNKLEECSNESGKLWANIKGWLNWSSSSTPSQLFHEGRMETSPISIASIMNHFYIEKVQTIRAELPEARVDPLQELRKQMRNSRSRFTIKPVHPDLILQILTSLRNSKATGVDHVDTFVLKMIKNEITPAITHIVNLSIRSSRFPNIWKHSKIIPLFKPGAKDKLSTKSYRPVALLPVVSKVLERVVFMQIVEYMDKNKLFHPNHHGFRLLHSTTTAMIQMYDTWVEAIDRGEMAGVTLIDQSAAFDCVDHGILKDKLKLYGFDEAALGWIEDYLASREQSCYVESFLSPALPVSVGVPQGSILGPLIYCIFTNDFPETVHGGDCTMEPMETDMRPLPQYRCHCVECGGVAVYADDSTYTASDSDQDKLSEKLSEKFEIMADYLTANRLKVNSDKTHLMVMTTQQYRRLHPTTVSITTEAGVIEATQVERLLGAFIHQDMKWTEYIRNNDNSLLHCLNQRLGALKKVSRSASFQARLTVANGIFMSKLIFMIALWSGCQEFLINSLQVCQNKAARVVTKRDFSTPIKQLLKECGWR